MSSLRVRRTHVSSIKHRRRCPPPGSLFQSLPQLHQLLGHTRLHRGSGCLGWVSISSEKFIPSTYLQVLSQGALSSSCNPCSRVMLPYSLPRWVNGVWSSRCRMCWPSRPSSSSKRPAAGRILAVPSASAPPRISISSSSRVRRRRPRVARRPPRPPPRRHAVSQSSARSPRIRSRSRPWRGPLPPRGP